MGVINVTFKPGGEVVVAPRGFKGEDCRAATQPYINRQAGVIVEDRPTAEAGELPQTVALGSLDQQARR